MYGPQSPVLPPSVRPYGVAPMAVSPAAPQAVSPVVVNVNNQPVAANGLLGSIGTTLKNLFTSIVNFFKKLFGGSAAGATTPVAPTPTPAAPPAAGLAGDDATLAAQFGLLNQPANIAAFRQAVSMQMAEKDVVGPGSTNRDAVVELQGLLSQWGFQVPTTGNFDPATADAVMRFKAQHGVTESFVFANGQAGTTPFVDAKTKAKMIQLLQGGQASVPGATPAAPIVAPAPVPPIPAAPPPPPPPAPLPPPPPLPVAQLPGVSPSPAPVNPSPTPAPAPAAGALSAAEQQAAQAAGILATRENLTAFQAASAELERTKAMGPGSNDNVDAVRELQQVLSMWGFQVPTSGVFDPATVTAVLNFKKAENLYANYQMADGTKGLHPFIDEATKAAMIRKLGG